MGNELTSQQERVPTQQTMLRPGTGGNGISGGLQMCQLECERHIRYANEGEKPSGWHLRPIYSTAAAPHRHARLWKRWPGVAVSVFYDKLLLLWVIDSNLGKLIQYF